jgi:hypothetical protein
MLKIMLAPPDNMLKRSMLIVRIFHFGVKRIIDAPELKLHAEVSRSCLLHLAHAPCGFPFFAAP